jgi:uncharacterized protein (DUF58 family)
MQHAESKTFDYHIGWRSRNRHAGQHVSTERGLGMEFRGHTTLLSYPDPRRIDIRQTIRDPLEQIYVRLFNQKSASPVFAAFDLSGSMNFGSQKSKLAIGSDIIRSITLSATQNNDPIGLIGFDHSISEEYHTPLQFRPHQALAIADKLADYQATQIAGDGITSIADHLPRERSLIFLISDFHMPLDVVENAISHLMRHHVVPIVIWDSTEYENLPEFGITTINDPETGEERTLFIRKEMRSQIIESFHQRKQDLSELLMRYNMPPFFVEGEFDADLLTEYFHQFVAG